MSQDESCPPHEPTGRETANKVTPKRTEYTKKCKKCDKPVVVRVTTLR